MTVKINQWQRKVCKLCLSLVKNFGVDKILEGHLRNKKLRLITVLFAPGGF